MLLRCVHDWPELADRSSVLPVLPLPLQASGFGFTLARITSRPSRTRFAGRLNAGVRPGFPHGCCQLQGGSLHPACPSRLHLARAVQASAGGLAAPRLRTDATLRKIRPAESTSDRAQREFLAARGAGSGFGSGECQLQAARPDMLYCFAQGLGCRKVGCKLGVRRPNKSFKPKPLRYANHMAGKACHVLRSTTRLGLTLALGR